jgi:Cys-tRNA(Pro) deacylase
VHHVVKRLVMENENAEAFIVLMHGDRKVSTKELARVTGAKRVAPCASEAAQRHSGYRVGGTSPFGTRKRLPVYMQKSIVGLPRIYINGGSRGFLVGMAPQAIVELLRPVLVEVAIAL